MAGSPGLRLEERCIRRKRACLLVDPAGQLCFVVRLRTTIDWSSTVNVPSVLKPARSYRPTPLERLPHSDLGDPDRNSTHLS